jgi:hypothetical protein
MALSALELVGSHLLVLLALAATAYVAGRLAMQGLLEPAGAADCISLGLVVLATIGCLLGLAGRLSAAPLLGVVALVHLAGLGHWRAASSRLRARWQELPPARLAGWIAIGALLGAPLFALTLYPPTAFDETLYHLPFARAFAATGGLPFLPDLRFPVFPQLSEVLDAELLLVSDDVATHLVSVLAVGLVAAQLMAWGREWRVADGSASSGWLAAAAWLGNPIVVYVAGADYVEPLLALFVTGACRAFSRWRREGGSGWLAVAAAFAGAAAGTKYLGLFFVLALALATVLGRRPLAPRRLALRARDLLLFAAMAAVVMAPWYGRILAFTGNPVFPYLSGIFGAHAWTPARFRTLGVSSLGSLTAAGLVRYVARLVTLPWDVIARRQLVGGLPPFSPFGLLGAPLAVVVACRERGLRAVLALAASFLVLFPLLPADSRYLLTVVPLLSLLLGVAAAKGAGALAARSTARRWVVVGLAVLLVLPGWLYALHRLVRQGPPPTTAAARETYLLRSLPLYPAVARLQRTAHPGDTVYGLFAEEMRDFVGVRFLSDWYGPYRYATLGGVLREPGALGSVLRAMGVDYLLVARGRAAEQSFAEPGAGSGFELLYEDRHALLYALRPEAGGE